MRPLRNAFTWGALLAALGAGAALSGPAQADSSSSAGPQCSLSGTVTMPVNLEIFAKDNGGDAVARFTGSPSKLVAYDFPANPSLKRVPIKTGTGKGSFRIEGFVDASKVPLFTSGAVSVVQGNLWIADHQSVDFLGARPGKLQIRKNLSFPVQQSFTTWTPCNTLSLEGGTTAGFTPAGNARGFIVKKDSIDLYDGPNGAQVTTLYKAPAAAGILLWSMEIRQGWVHVQYQGEVVVDAWARWRDLKALPPGETMDQVAGPMVRPIPPRLALKADAQVITTTKEVALKLSPKDDAETIGVIEPGTETYVLDKVVGYASVLPKALNIAPTGDDQFWAKASDL